MGKSLGIPALGAAALFSAAAGAGTFPITPLLLEGDLVPGVGNVTTIDNIAVNNSGQWMVEADTNNADTNTDSVLMRTGALHLREGDPIAPAGASIGSFDSININNGGNSGWNFFLDGTGSTSTDSGVYFNTTLLIQESNLATAPGFSPGTPYIGWFEVKINNNDDMLMMASVDDPAIASTVDRAIVKINPVSGVQTLLAKEGDVLPGQAGAVEDFGTGPHTFAYNDNDDVMFFADVTGSTATDGLIYLNSAILAQEGSPSPVAGRNWSGLSSPELDINNSGEYVFSGTLDGDTNSNLLIVKNGAKFVQEGDSLPSIGAFTFTSFGSGPIEIDDSGNVLWYGDWNDADTNVDEGLFWNDVLIVQEGVTTIGGVLVDTLRGVEDGYHMSDNGRYVIFEAILVNGIEGAFMIEVPEPASALLLLGGLALMIRRR
ncbi:MAG: PEP-CTERM sorting domain-containing protein [Phycisphaerae bacterium]|jgi:hypothetical protein